MTLVILSRDAKQTCAVELQSCVTFNTQSLTYPVYPHALIILFGVGLYHLWKGTKNLKRERQVQVQVGIALIGPYDTRWERIWVMNEFVRFTSFVKITPVRQLHDNRYVQYGHIIPSFDILPINSPKHQRRIFTNIKYLIAQSTYRSFVANTEFAAM